MKGHVRGTETPDEYVKEWEGDPWYEPIAQAHDLLSAFIPGYTPTQIKLKYGALYYYYLIDAEAIDPHDPKRRLYQKLADAIILQAELECNHRLEERRRWAEEQARREREEEE